MRRRWFTTAWRALAAVLLAYIAYSMHVASGGMTLGYFLQSINPMRTVEKPAPGPAISYDSLFPEPASQAIQDKLEQDKAKGR